MYFHKLTQLLQPVLSTTRLSWEFGSHFGGTAVSRSGELPTEPVPQLFHHTSPLASGGFCLWIGGFSPWKVLSGPSPIGTPGENFFFSPGGCLVLVLLCGKNRSSV